MTDRIMQLIAGITGLCMFDTGGEVMHVPVVHAAYQVVIGSWRLQFVAGVAGCCM